MDKVYTHIEYYDKQSGKVLIASTTEPILFNSANIVFVDLMANTRTIWHGRLIRIVSSTHKPEPK